MRLIFGTIIFSLIINISLSDNIGDEKSSTANFVTVLDPPTRFKVENITDISAHVIWSQPLSQINITQYELEAKVLNTFAKETLYSPKWTFSNNIFRSEISNLHPGTEYNVSIRAISKYGPGQEKFLIFETQIAEPDEAPKELKVIKRDEKTMTVRIFPSINNNGPISFYRLVVMNIEQMQVFQQNLLSNYDQAMRNGLSYYIAADLKSENINEDFIIGDRKNYNGYYNAPLEEDSRYYAFVGIISTINTITKVRFPDSITRRTVFQGSDNSGGAGLVVGLAVAVAIASILLIIGVVVLVLVRHRFHRHRRQRLSDNQELCVQGPMIPMANQAYIPDDELERVNHYNILKQNVWNIPRDSLQINSAANTSDYLGFGFFGHVVQGTVKKPNENTPTHVACYIITDGDLNSENKRLMLRKLDVLVKAGKHENLINLIGTCENLENVYIVLEHAPLNLKEMLINSRHANHPNGKITSIKENDILEILIGVANGMNHLEKKNLLHERLCARNVLMFDGQTPKITGHGISHYNRNNIALDFSRWTAPEILSGKSFSIKSDVWSYGCLMWEVCSLGGTPYNHLDAKRVFYEVCRGVRLPMLPYISEEFYQIMISCWQNDPGERPNFHEISEQLIYVQSTLSNYLHLNFDATSDFSFEAYVLDMEFAEDVCERSATYS